MNETEKLVAAVETAAILLSSPESTVDMLFMLAEARQHIQELTARNAELLDHSNRPLIDAERESYQRALANLDREIADVRSLLDIRENEIADMRSLLDIRENNLAYWKQRANELSDRVTADVQPLLVGDPLAATARVYLDSRNKITAIKALRSYTGLGLLEAKLAVEQVIRIVEMKEATD